MGKIIVGIDEVGRGPLAGPVSIGIAVLFEPLDIPELNDSKQMTEKARERVAALARELKDAGRIDFGVYSVSANVIDTRGIEFALRSAIETGLTKLKLDPSEVTLKLDGRLKAPKDFEQESLIHGDALVPAISLASVVAKVTRDHYMSHTADHEYPIYGFKAHKGYGTAAHIHAIRTHGLCPLHRRSFLRNIVVDLPHE